MSESNKTFSLSGRREIDDIADNDRVVFTGGLIKMLALDPAAVDLSIISFYRVDVVN